MKAAEVFGIVVRAVGLIVVLLALGLIFPAILSLVMGGPGELIGLLFYGIPALVVGLWLLRGAGPLVSFAFPRNPRGNG